jgi:hypothetical protein
VEFDGAAEARQILGGLGNVDMLSVESFPPAGAPLEAMTLRLFDPETRLWRIWFMSTRYPGQLDTPVEGRFDGDHGRFECDDVLGSMELRVRYDWYVLSETDVRWEQSFSYDAGETWRTNWVMTGARDD